MEDKLMTFLQDLIIRLTVEIIPATSEHGVWFFKQMWLFKENICDSSVLMRKQLSQGSKVS